ncbi:MAG TPA: hypothetical protein VKI17_10480 [Gemmataceae bacterium]|nr:hypothetical protein [Gemmataceae bacterium]
MDTGDPTPMNGMFERSRPFQGAEGPSLSAEDFQKAFGEDLRGVLDVDRWRVGSDLAEEYERMDSEIRQAVAEEDALQERIRTVVFPKLEELQRAPNAGVHAARPEELEAVHRGLLFNGGVDACYGSLRVHQTLPLTVYQIGVSLVSYQGDQGNFCQRLYRRDLRQSIDNPVEETLRILEGRAAADEDGGPGALIQKTLLAYAERAILVRRSGTVWRMGHGNPVTYEMLTGGGNLELMEACINVARELIEDHQKFVFVGTQPHALDLLTIGQALPPYHFAIVTKLSDRLGRWLHQGRFVDIRNLPWDGVPLSSSQWIPRFIKEVASQVVIGLFRASALTPAQLFFAHAEHADVAAHIAVADSMLREPHGSPLLLAMARHVGEAVFGDNLETLAESAYAAAGAPWRYRTGRTR